MPSTIRSLNISSATRSITFSKSTSKVFDKHASQQRLARKAPYKSNKFATLADITSGDDHEPEIKGIGIMEPKNSIIGIEKTKIPPRQTTQDRVTVNVSPQEASNNIDWAVIKQKEAATTIIPIAALPVRRQMRKDVREVAHWRNGEGKDINASGYTKPRVGGPRTRATCRTACKIFHSISVDDLWPGVLVWHLDTRECHDELRDTGTDFETFKSPDGQLHLRKPRFWYVLNVQEHHFNELPIYTYRRQGIAKKSEKIKKQHVGIRPLHISPEEYVRQNDYAPLEIEELREKDDVIDPLSVLHFTEQRSTSFDTPIRIIGTVTARSVAQVNKLRKQFDC